MPRHLRTRKFTKALNSYVMTLGPALTKRYGLKSQYTVLQVSRTLSALKLDRRYLAYAVALFRHTESDNTICLLKLDQSFLETLRSELAVILFSGNPGYSVEDILRLSRKRGWQGGPPPNWRYQLTGRTSL